MRTSLEIVFWLASGLIVWTQLGYPLAPFANARAKSDTPPAAGPPPPGSLIVAAHDEQTAIAAKVANALALDYPRELLEVIVACDGCVDETARLARAAGAD